MRIHLFFFLLFTTLPAVEAEQIRYLDRPQDARSAFLTLPVGASGENN